MGSKWEDFVDNLKDDAGTLAKKELKEFINNSKTDSDAFIQRQGQKLELYLNQLAAGAITKKQFEGYVLDVKDLTEMHALKMSVAAKAKAQYVAVSIANLIIDGLLKLV
jgi:hypothetical protein